MKVYVKKMFLLFVIVVLSLTALSLQVFASDDDIPSDGVPFDFDVIIDGETFDMKDFYLSTGHVGHLYFGTYPSGTKVTIKPKRFDGDDEFIYGTAASRANFVVDKKPSLMDIDTLEFLEEDSPVFDDVLILEEYPPLYASRAFDDYKKLRYQTFDVPSEYVLTESGNIEIVMEVRFKDRSRIEKRGSSFLLLINDGDGYVIPDFEITGVENNKDIIEARRLAGDKTVYFFGPDKAIIKDTSVIKGDVEIVDREWVISWNSSSSLSQLSQTSDIFNDKSNSEEIIVDLETPGIYTVNLKLTDQNGSIYTAQRALFAKEADVYLQALLYRIEDPHDLYLEYVSAGQIRTHADGTVEYSDFHESDGPKTKDDVLEYLDTLSSDKQELLTGLFSECELDIHADLDCSDRMNQLIEDFVEKNSEIDYYCDNFPDLTKYKVNELICLASRSLQNRKVFEGDGGGETAGYLRPDSQINRAEICAVLNKSKISMIGALVPESVENTKFSDLTKLANDDWVKTNASTCLEFQGYDDGTFRPNSNISLAEVLKVLLVLYGENSISDDNNIKNYCSELNSKEWYSGYMALAHEKGFLIELEDSCNPSFEVSRGDVIKMMFLMYKEYIYISPFEV